MSVDIKSTYGALGDVQIATAVLTINGTALSSTTNLWASGDVGKCIAIEGAGTAGTNNPLQAFATTIAAFTDAKHVTLTDAAPTAYTAVSHQVEWGTDDNAAFTAFHTAQQGNSGVVLTIPPGRYGLMGNPLPKAGGNLTQSNLFTTGIPDLTINGDVASNPIITDFLGAGNSVFMGTAQGALTDTGDGATSAFFQTAAAGSTVLTLITHTDISLFSANSWVCVTGLDIQGFGFPPNTQSFEFTFMTAIHNGAGGADPSTVTLQSGLKSRYSSAWPNFNSPSLPGPAKLYQVTPSWAGTQTYNNLVMVSNFTLTNCAAQNLTLNNFLCPNFGMNPTQTQNAVFNNYTVNTQWELDKIIENLTLNNCTVHALTGADSCSPNVLTLNNTTISGGPNIGAKKVVASGCTIGTGLHLGPGSYGVSTGSASFSNCSIGGLDTFGGDGETDLAGAGAYTMSGGVISRVKTAGTGAPPQWAAPGGWCYFGGFRTTSSAFQVLDITDDGTSIHMTTNLSGGFPTQYNGAGVVIPINVNSAPTSRFSFSGCTGSDVAVGLSDSSPGTRPYCSYWKFAYQGLALRNTQTIIPVFGNAVSFIVDVTTPFSGTGALSVNLATPFCLDSTNHVVTWSPSIDLRTSGKRTITPSGVTGTAGADSGLALPDPVTWLLGDQMQPTLSANISGQSVGTYPVFTITIVTDQGIPFQFLVAPLRLRLHA